MFEADITTVLLQYASFALFVAGLVSRSCNGGCSCTHSNLPNPRSTCVAIAHGVHPSNIPRRPIDQMLYLLITRSELVF